MRSLCSSGKKLKSELGWGKTTTSNKTVEDRSNVLLEVELSILDCRRLFEDYNDTSSKIDCTNDFIFAAGFGKKHLRCKRLIYTNLIFLPQTLLQADSGGPLTYKSGNQHVLIGDTSFGDQCALAGRYGVYGRVSFFRQWIEGKMSSPTYCSSGPDADA